MNTLLLVACVGFFLCVKGSVVSQYNVRVSAVSEMVNQGEDYVAYCNIPDMGALDIIRKLKVKWLHNGKPLTDICEMLRPELDTKYSCKVFSPQANNISLELTISDITPEDAGNLECELLQKIVENGKWVRDEPVAKEQVKIGVRGGTISISAKFISGEVLFSWYSYSYRENTYYVRITRGDNVDPWDRVIGTEYKVKDALLYDSISIIVKASGDSTENMRTFKVSKVDSYVGDSVNISWTAPYFPKVGYTIYHTDKVNRSTSIIQVYGLWGRATFKRSKYEYVSRPYDSTNITFEIRDITADDAGYYNGGITAEDAWSDGGVVLIVHNKPSKPNIQGNLNITLNSSSELTCSSNSTTAPDYYARLRTLSYKWYVNSTRLYGETNDTLRLRVSKNHKYNQYSCTARDKLKSDRSDPVKINPMYTPDTLTVSPRPPFNLDNKLTVKEGETIGPYSCTADCNPPCDISWKYKDVTNGQFFDVASTAFLYSHIVNRSIELFRCVAKYSPGIGFRIIENIYLDVLYLDEPQLVYNENSPIYTSQEVQVQEMTSIHLYCHVNGNPNPTIRLRRGVNANVIAETNGTKWLNHTINSLQCSDTDEYTCSGDSTGLPSKKIVFRINVICDLRLNSKDTVELIKGFKVGSQRTVIINVPVIAYPPPVTSHFTWIDPEGQVIKDTNIVLYPTHELYSYLITSVVLLPEVEHYGEYSVQYNGKPLTKIQITKTDNILSEPERKSTLKIVTTSHDETRRDVKAAGQENQNVLDLEIEKLKLENRKLHEEIQRTQLEKETLQAARNLYNAKLMLILKENKEVAPSIVGQL